MISYNEQQSNVSKLLNMNQNSYFETAKGITRRNEILHYVLNKKLSLHPQYTILDS